MSDQESESAVDHLVALAGRIRVSGYERTSSMGNRVLVSSYWRSPSKMLLSEIAEELSSLGNTPRDNNRRVALVSEHRRRTMTRLNRMADPDFQGPPSEGAVDRLRDLQGPPASDAPDVGDIMAYEEGELDEEQTVELFSKLVKSGVAWSLQGSYGRTARALIDGGYLDEDGNIL